jgi:hypothetical protein
MQGRTTWFSLVEGQDEGSVAQLPLELTPGLQLNRLHGNSLEVKPRGRDLPKVQPVLSR